MSQGTVAVGQLDTTGGVLSFKKGMLAVTSSVPGVHILDAMTSGCGLVVQNRTAYTVGYSCTAFPCPPASQMSLFGIDVETGVVTLNVSTPFPWWENMDDHHTTLRQTHGGDLVVSGIVDTSNKERPLIGGVVVMGTDGTVRAKHVISQPFGHYIKGPMAFDDSANAVYDPQVVVATYPVSWTLCSSLW